MARTLDLGGVRLPIDVLTSTIAVLGIRGSGKTNTAAAIVEEATALGVPSAVTDPTGAWWGLKSSVDGKSAGLPFYVFGGEHADVPLEAETGEFLGSFVVEKRVPTICDVSLLRKGRQVHFTANFLEQVYEQNREPLLVTIDEAHRFIPQTARREANPDIMRCVGAVEDIGMLGRKRGLGCILVAQRAAMVNKNALAQCHTLIVHQTNAPQDKKAIDDWIGEHFGAGDEREQFLRALPMLKKGEAFIWSPTFNLFQRAQIRQRRTFDSGATPEIGKRVREATVFASVDLAALTKDLAAVKQRADENDPKHLLGKIQALQRHIDKLEEERAPSLPPPERVEVPVLTNEDREQLRRLHGLIAKVLPMVVVTQARSFKDPGELMAALKPIEREAQERGLLPGELRAEKRAVRVHGGGTVFNGVPLVDDRPPGARANPDIVIPEGERKVLTAIVQFKRITREHISLVTGYKRSTRNAYIQRLRAAGYVDESGDRVYATSAGVNALGLYEQLPTGVSLQRYWLRMLPAGESKILECVLEDHPRPVSREDLSELTGFKRSTRNAYIQRLATRELIEVVGEGVKASDFLFGGAR